MQSGHVIVEQEDEGAPQGDHTRQEQAEFCMVLSTNVYDPQWVLRMALLKASTGAILRTAFPICCPACAQCQEKSSLLSMLSDILEGSFLKCGHSRLSSESPESAWQDSLTDTMNIDT